MPKGTATTNEDSFGQRFIALCGERGMTQVRLAQTLRVS